MNAGIVTSSVVGGILLLAILSLSVRFSKQASESTFSDMTKEKVSAVSEMITYDFKKVGYGASSTKISTADSTHFVFKADIDNDGSEDQVSWQWTTTDVTSSDNPNDRLLVRTVTSGGSPNTTNIKPGITHFEVNYYDEDHQPTNVPSEIRQIEVELEVQSAEPVGNKYLKSNWSRLYVPWNIQNH